MYAYIKLHRRIIIDILHLFVMVGFAIAQPLYDLLGKNTEFFVAHAASPIMILIMVLVLSVSIPLVLALIELAVRPLGERVRRSLHSTFVFALAVLAFLPLMKRLGFDADIVVLSLALIAALVSVIIYVRLQPVRNFITVLSPAFVVFPLLFITFTPVNRLVLPQTIDALSEIEIRNPVPITLVVLDEFCVTELLDETAQIDKIRFPNFAEFAEQSWWFQNAVATHTRTDKALPAILTGSKPQLEMKRNTTAEDYPENIFVLLGEHYQMNVLESITKLCPDVLCNIGQNRATTSQLDSLLSDIVVVYMHIVSPSKWSLSLPPLDGRWTGFRGVGKEKGQSNGAANKKYEKRAGHFDRFLSNIDGNKDAQLNFLHLLLPHIPYEYLSTGHRYGGGNYPYPEGLTNEATGWTQNETLVRVAYLQKLQQIGFVDKLLGKLIRKLKDEGVYDKSLIIVTADHGVSFQPAQPWRKANKNNASDILNVPMLVKLPKQREGKVSENLVSGLDIVPTITDVLGIRLPWEVDGRSMFSKTIPPREGIEIAGSGYFQARDIAGFLSLKWKIQNFGSRTPLNHLTSKGPYPDLIGKKLGELNVVKAGSMRFSSEVVNHFGYVEPTSGYLPALVTGEIEGANDYGLPLAIALNGRIWATTNTVSWHERDRYVSVLLPTSAFIEGRNILEVFLIEETDNGLQLSAVPYAGQEKSNFTISHGPSGREVLAQPDGSLIHIDTGNDSILGNMVDFLDGRMLFISGWAGDSEYQPVESVVVFAGKHSVAQTRPRLARKDVVDAFKKTSILYSGFRTEISLEMLPMDMGEVRVFAISKGKLAREFKLRESVRQQIQEVLLQRAIKSKLAVKLNRQQTGNEIIVYDNGPTITVDNSLKSIRGNVDRVSSKKRMLRITGWAADVSESRPARSVLAFSGDRLVAYVTPRQERPDVAKHFGKEALHYSGFEVMIPLEFVQSNEKKVRVFIISSSNDRAIELKVP